MSASTYKLGKFSKGEGKNLTPIFFWKPQTKDGYLGNWFLCDFKGGEDDPFLYNCTEQYVMVMKAKVFRDNIILEKIKNTKDPKTMRGLGRLVEGFDTKEWDKVKEDIYGAALLLKFESSDQLKSALLGTGNRVLVEASPSDNIWGIGMKASDAKKCKPEDWPGTNLLGKTLMKVRSILRLKDLGIIDDTDTNPDGKKEGLDGFGLEAEDGKEVGGISNSELSDGELSVVGDEVVDDESGDDESGDDESGDEESVDEGFVGEKVVVKGASGQGPSGQHDENEEDWTQDGYKPISNAPETSTEHEDEEESDFDELVKFRY